MTLTAVFSDWDDLVIDGAVRMLEDAGWDVRLVGSRDVDEVIARSAGAVGLCVGYLPVTERLLGALPDLRVVATSSAGYDSIDVDAATAHGVWVANLPGVATEEVATHALAMMLALVRELPRLDSEVKRGVWSLTRTPLPRVPEDLTLGLLGLGRIGRRVAELARPFFSRVLAYDPAITQAPGGVALVDRDSLLAAADVLSLHLPSRHDGPAEIGRRELEMLPPGATVINTGRGALIDVAALRAALDSHHLSAAGLDVFDVEPPGVDHPLAGHPRVLATPHAAFLSGRTLRRYPEGQAQNLLAWARTGRPLTPIAGPVA